MAEGDGLLEEAKNDVRCSSRGPARSLHFHAIVWLTDNAKINSLVPHHWEPMSIDLWWCRPIWCIGHIDESPAHWLCWPYAKHTHAKVNCAKRIEATLTSRESPNYYCHQSFSTRDQHSNWDTTRSRTRTIGEELVRRPTDPFLPHCDRQFRQSSDCHRRTECESTEV